MHITLGDIAKETDGVLVGTPEKIITGVALVDEATPDQITFTDDKQTLQELDSDGVFEAGAVIVPSDYEGARTNIIKVRNPELACVKTILLFHPRARVAPEISSRADVHSSAIVGEDVFVAPFASIGARARIGDRAAIHAGVCIDDDVVIGDDTTLHYHVMVLSRTQIGNRVVIHPGSVIGSEGFGYVADGGELHKIPHVGRVIIEDDVEIGACNTIERANLGQTLIEQGVKTGNLVHIGHNVTVGKNTRIVAQAGIAGNTVVGDNVKIGGQAGIEQNLAIGDNAVIGPQTGIITDVADDENVFGTPGMPHRAWLRSGILIPKLWQMQKEMTRTARRLDALVVQLGR